MNKVIIIGCPGSGKSTFARKLSSKIKIPVYHMDMLWHKKDKTTITKAELEAKLTTIMKKEKWIIDGNYFDTMKKRVEMCDTIIFLDYPVELCLESVKKRIGNKREDIPWIEEEFDPEFKEWIKTFPTKIKPRIMELLSEYRDRKKIVIFKSRNDSEQYLKGI